MFSTVYKIQLTPPLIFNTEYSLIVKGLGSNQTHLSSITRGVENNMWVLSSFCIFYRVTTARFCLSTLRTAKHKHSLFISGTSAAAMQPSPSLQVDEGHFRPALSEALICKH